MKRYKIIFIFLFACNCGFADNIKESIAKVPISSIPFDCTKNVFYPKPAYGFPAEISGLPLATYTDLGLTQKNSLPSIDFMILRRFKTGIENFDLIALDICVSDWSKKLLAIYHENRLIDCVEVEVSWWSQGSIFVKQWRIDENQKIIVTWLKVNSPTPVSAFSNFNTINAQRIDIYYEVDSSGKFQEIKQVKYQPQIYTRSYLTDKTKNLWEGNEVPEN